MAGPYVHLDADAGIVLVRFDRPPVNAIDLDFVREWDTALEDVATRADVRAVVLTGTGTSFSAGLDLKAVPRYGADAQAEMLTRINRALACLYGLPVPVVAAVNGHAIAAGLVLALACDYRVGGDVECRLGLPEVRAGIPFPAAAMAVVRGELAPAVARRLTLLGRNYGPRDALADGVLDELAAPEALASRARAVAQELAASPRDAYARVKQQLRADTLAACRRAVEQGDPQLASWLAPRTGAAAAAVLRG
jgi:enoyl-CoA hydratase/carnithine racemase